MFSTDPTITDLKLKERNLYKAFFSMNFHQVATPELGVDDARCYIFFFREIEKFSAYIELYMPNTGRQLYYTFSSNPFPAADLPMVTDEARAFGEDMGFFLDEKSFAASSVAEKNQWIDEQPLFGFKSPEDSSSVSQTTETAAAPAPEPEPSPASSVAANTVATTIPESSQTATLPTVVSVPLSSQTVPAAASGPQKNLSQPMQQKEVESQIGGKESGEVLPSNPKNTEAPRSFAEKPEALSPKPRTVQPRQVEKEQPSAQRNQIPAQKQQAKKETRDVLGVVNREMEVLARLMASF